MPLQASFEKQSMEWKPRLSNKEKAQDAVVNKESNADRLLGHKRPITVDFLEKGATVNSASYCQLLGENSPYLLNGSYIYRKV